MPKLCCGTSFGVSYCDNEIICSFIVDSDTPPKQLQAFEEALCAFAHEIMIEEPRSTPISEIVRNCLKTGFCVVQHVFDVSNALYNIRACAEYVTELYNFYCNGSAPPRLVH